MRAPSKAEAVRAMYAQSPAALSGLDRDSGAQQIRPGLGSVTLSSPRASPSGQRKTSCMALTGSSSQEKSFTKPYTRERKNSISEISDNEDDLLEYHRWQKEERLREQEMEKQVGDAVKMRECGRNRRWRQRHCINRTCIHSPGWPCTDGPVGCNLQLRVLLKDALM